MGQNKMNPVNWFEIPVNNILRAKEFYDYVFDTELSFQEMKRMKMAMFPMVENGIGSSGALIEAKGYSPHHSGTIVYFSVHDINGVLLRVQDKGGKVLIPKTDIGEYGFVAHFEDCEGNQIALHSKQ